MLGLFGNNTGNNAGVGGAMSRPGITHPYQPTPQPLPYADQQQQQQQQAKSGDVTLEALKQKILKEVEEENRRLRAEEERLRQEEYAKHIGGRQQHQKQGSDNSNNNNQESIGGKFGKKALHIFESKKTAQGAVIPIKCQLVTQGTPSQLADYTPYNGTHGEWNYTYDKGTHDTNPASSWRSIYNDNGPMKNYMYHKMSPIQSDITTSRLVCKEGLKKMVRNDSPFTIGVFLINAPVSRTPENVLFKDRIEKIKRAFAEAVPNSSLALIDIIPPQSLSAYDEDYFYRRDDVTTDEDLLTGGVQSHAWMRVSREDIEESVLNDCVDGLPGSPNRVVYLKEDSALHRFIKRNFRDILRELDEPTNQVLSNETWTLNAERAYPKEICNILSESELKRVVRAYAILGKYVDAAKRMSYAMLDKLPYENIEQHQFFIARLCADRWFDPYKPNMTPEEAEEFNRTPMYIGIDLEVWFSVVTDKKNDPSEQKRLEQLRQQQQPLPQHQMQQFRH